MANSILKEDATARAGHENDLGPSLFLGPTGRKHEPPLDQTAGAVGTGTIPSSGIMTPSVTGELVIGSGTHNGNTVTTAGPGFTMIAVPTEDSNTHQPLAMEYQVLSGNRQTAATFNLAVGYPWTQNGVLFKPAVQGPPTALSITTQSLPNATASVSYSATLAATGGTLPYTWSISAGHAVA